MRKLTVLSLWFAASLAWAWHPPCNITRGLYCSASPLLSTTFWSAYAGDWAFDDQSGHAGPGCARLTTTDPKAQGSGLWQTVDFGQNTPAPIKIAGWSKAENVSGDKADHQYSIYVDMVHTDGSHLAMQIACFQPGTHDWEYSEALVKPEKPLATARVYLMLRWRTGTAWFDDVFVGSPDGPNLLKNADFAAKGRQNTELQNTVYATYADLNANAIHTYMSGAPSYWRGPEGAGNEDVRRFLGTAKSRGLGVWLTIGDPSTTGFKDSNDPKFPEYNCVSGDWGKSYTESLALAAGYDLAGVSLVPDEYNWTNDPMKEAYSKHSDPKVAEFYQNLPPMCNCPLCAARFEKTWGQPLPDLRKGLFSPAHDPALLRYLKQRYDSTAEWIGRSVQAIRRVNPSIVTDSLICVSPICSDYWFGTGVAWDRLNETGLDMPTTDPYLQLHNYLGDSTHWYVTETAAHLTAATPRRQCGIVLEASRLRAEYRELDPVEIYGSALSAVCHGAKELAWWHYDHLTDRSKSTDRSDVSRAAVRGVYGLLKQADPWLGDLRPLKRVAYLHSRAADDLWRFYADAGGSEVLTHPNTDKRYAAVAQQQVLYYLFRHGVPTDLFYLEAATEAQLKDYPVIVVPFALAISDRQAALLRRLATAGKSLIIISEVGSLDELGLPRQPPALLDLCGLKSPPTGEVSGPLLHQGSALPDTGDEPFTGYAHVEPLAPNWTLATINGVPAVGQHRVGRGQVFFMAGAFGYDLPLHRDNHKRTREERIIPDPYAPGHAAVMGEVLGFTSSRPPSLATKLPAGKDVETAFLTNSRGELVVLAINWESEALSCQLELPRAGRLRGFRLQADGACQPASTTATGPAGVVKLDLKPQEATLWHMLK